MRSGDGEHDHQDAEHFLQTANKEHGELCAAHALHHPAKFATDSPADDEASTRQEAADGSDDDQIWWINQRIVVMRRLTQNLFNRCERRDVTDDEDANRRRARAFRIQHRWQSQSRHGEE